MIKLPKHNITLDLKATIEALNGYWTEYASVWDLFDATNAGPHDKITPLDVLSLNALNAWGLAPPMRAMDSLWQDRRAVEKLLAAIPHDDAVTMSKAELAAAVQALEAAADYVWDLSGWGDTSTSKFLHRMRPALAPIWDTFVDRFYGMSEAGYGDYYREALGDIRTNAKLLKEAIDNSVHPQTSAVRAWDILLWSKSPAQRVK